ncbi:MAG: hypothetical protein IKR52_00975 [Paludibacteraceae bacterium]|nr:hypothetical protein [Paludibacteraceae bacterium]
MGLLDNIGKMQDMINTQREANASSKGYELQEQEQEARLKAEERERKEALEQGVYEKLQQFEFDVDDAKTMSKNLMALFDMAHQYDKGATDEEHKEVFNMIANKILTGYEMLCMADPTNPSMPIITNKVKALKKRIFMRKYGIIIGFLSFFAVLALIAIIAASLS